LLAALHEQAQSGEKLGQILVNHNLLTAEELNLFLQIQAFPIPVEFSEDSIDLMMLKRINEEFCLQRKIVPLHGFRSSCRPFLALAMANPQDSVTIDLVKRKTAMLVIPF